MRYYDVNEGNIYYDNYHIKDMNRTGLRNKIAYVAQESFSLVVVSLIIWYLV